MSKMTEHNNPQDNITVSRELLRQALVLAEDSPHCTLDFREQVRAVLYLQAQEDVCGAHAIAAECIRQSEEGNYERSLFRQAGEHIQRLLLAQQPAPEINQCDGCRMGQELRNGLHIDRNGTAQMTCQAHRYKQPAPVKEPVVTLCVKREADKLMLHYKRDEAALDLLDGEYKLYTAQPRKAVKLTDEEIERLRADADAYHALKAELNHQMESKK